MFLPNLQFRPQVEVFSTPFVKLRQEVIERYHFLYRPFVRKIS